MSAKSSPDLMSQIFGTISQYILSVIKCSSNHKEEENTQQEVDSLHNLKKTIISYRTKSVCIINNNQSSMLLMF